MHLDLIQPVLSLYLDRYFVRSFINIFIDIFYNLNYNANLDINISIIFINTIRIVKDNKTIIKTDLLSIDNTNYKLAVIISAINWITIVGHLGLIRKRLWKTFHIP